MNHTLSFFIAIRIVDNIKNCLIKPINHLIYIAANIIVEPSSFHRQPDALDRIQIRRICRQKHRLQSIPIEGFLLMPGGIINNHDVFGPIKRLELIGFIQKGLECLGI